MEHDSDNVTRLVCIPEVELRLVVHEAFRLGACWSSDRRSTRYEDAHLKESYTKKLNELIAKTIEKKGA